MSDLLCCPKAGCGFTVALDANGPAAPNFCPRCGTPIGRDGSSATLSMKPAAYPPDDETLPPSAAAAVAAPVAAPGYEIVRELGRGGMGVVYQARQAELGRSVALKMILAGAHASAAELARFRTEAEAIARLQHPNIVQVFEIGQWRGEGGTPLPYFSLEFCGGGSLQDKLRGTPQEPREAARLVATLARAVAAAHRKGIVHRDLKPANVLLTEDGTPKITDFGLAKKLDADSGQTRSGSVMGTPSYMAPEQAGGKTGVVGPLADVYSLGAILYELLTGRPPFKAATPMDTLLQVLSDEPVPPCRLLPKIPRDLETICLKCLQKDPAKRYATAEALVGDLEAYLDGRPIAARPVGRVERAWRWCKRNKAIASALLGGSAALIVGSTVAIGFGVDASLSAKKARKEAERADREKAAAGRLAEANLRQTVRLLVSRGNQFVREGDFGGALPWFAEAARLAPDDPAGLARLEAALAPAPRPVYLWRHREAANHVAVSPDGRLAVTASHDGKAYLWDLETGQRIGEPLQHGSPIMAAAFSPDGQRVATAGGALMVSGEVRVWESATGKPIGEPIRQTSLVIAVGFAADGSRVVTLDFTLPFDVVRGGLGAPRMTFRTRAVAGGNAADVPAGSYTDQTTLDSAIRIHAATGRVLAVDDKQVRVVDVATAKVLGEPWSHDQRIWFARLSPNGARAITISVDGTGKVRDLTTGKESAVTIGHVWRPLDACVDERGELAVAFYNGAVQRYQLAAGKAVPSSFEKLGKPGWSVRFSDDASLLAGLGKDGTARVWEVDGWRPVAPVLRHGAALTSCAFASAGRRLLVTADDGSVRVWDLAYAERPAVEFPTNDFNPTAIRFAGARECVLFGQGAALRFDATTGKPVDDAPAVAADPAARAMDLAPDGLRYAIGYEGNLARVFDVAGRRESTLPLKHDLKYVVDVKFSPDGRLLGTRDAMGDQFPSMFVGTARVWDLAGGKLLTDPPLRFGSVGVKGALTSTAFSPDGRWFAMAGGTLTGQGPRGEVQVHPVAPPGAGSKLLPGEHGPMPFELAFSSDSRRLAVLTRHSSTDTCGVEVWEVESGERAMPALRLPGEPGALAFEPGSGRLAVAAGSQVQVWDVAARKPVCSLAHDDNVTHLLYQRDGQVLLTIAHRQVYLWEPTTGEALRPPLRHPTRVSAAAVSPDGWFLVTACNDRRARIWPLTAGAAATESQRLARLVSCQEIDGTTAVPVTIDKVAADWEEVRGRAPALLTPPDAVIDDWHEQLAGRLAGAQLWTAATRHFEQVATRQPANHWARYLRNACYLATGAKDSLRQSCEEMLGFHRDSTNLYWIDWTVKSSLLAPGTVADPAPALRLAERLEGADPKHGDYPWFALTRAIAHYRAGRTDDAAVWLDRCRAVKQKPTTYATLADIFLAMVRRKQGRAAEAAELLENAARAVADMDRDPWRGSWWDRVHCRIALAEAQAPAAPK